MSYNNAITFLTRFIPYPHFEEKESIVEWKNKLLFVLTAGLIVLGFVAYVPSVLYSVAEKIWSVAILDTLMYASILYAGFSKTLSAWKKVNIILITFYLLGISLLYFVGPEGAGFNWLFVFPVLTSFFYGFRGVIWAALINFISLLLLSIPIYYFVPEPGMILQANYTLGSWLINVVNFMVITSFVSLSLSVIISSINHSLQKERIMTKKLKKNQKSLAFEKKRAEESDRLKSAFLANMSHEIRTPMNAILGFSEILGDPTLSPEEFKQYYSLVTMSGEQLLRIINDIIDISKIELNQMTINSGPVHINSCLSEVTKIYRDKIKTLRKDIRLDLQLPENSNDVVIESDEIRLKQIVNNLVGNAIKFTDSGSITIGYTLHTETDKADIEFFVKDTGRGIPKQAYKFIFDRFAQADNIKFKEGTGLGLSITKGLLQLLGGNIRVESELNNGSEFYFILPYNKKIVIPNAKLKTNKAGTNLDLSGKLIFIAEDDEPSYFYISLLLASTHATIRKATNGQQVLDLLKTETPDLILLDINMPVMNGFQAIQEIRKTLPDLPVIAQTAYAMPEERQKCFDLGCNEYISKPIKADHLFKIIEPFFPSKKKIEIENY